MNDEDDIDFAAQMRGVKRLHDDRAPPETRRGRPAPPTRRPPADASPTTHAPAPAFAEQGYFAAGIQARQRRRIRQGVPRPEARLDLHGLGREQALRRLERFVDAAREDGRRMLLVVHGQGHRSAEAAVLKPLARRWLAAHPAVLACCPAQPRDGADGASYVYLRAG